MEQAESKIHASLLSRFGKRVVRRAAHHYRIEIVTEANRSQIVEFLYRQKETEGADFSRYIAVSPIGPVFRSLNYEEIMRLNSSLNVGAICVDTFENQEGVAIPYLAVRATHIVITAQLEEVVELVLEVARVADQLEKELFARDIY